MISLDAFEAAPVLSRLRWQSGEKLTVAFFHSKMEHFRGVGQRLQANLSRLCPLAGEQIVATHETFSGFFRLSR